MDNVALAQINTFGTAPKADSVPHSEEPVFILNASQLSAILAKAVQPLKDHIESMEKIVAAQGKQIAALEATEEHDVNRICLDIAYDRQRLARLEKIEPQPLQMDRGEILRALLAANGGKMLAKEARQKMHLSKNRFSELLKTCDYVETKPLHSDRRKDIIILKSELVPRN